MRSTFIRSLPLLLLGACCLASPVLAQPQQALSPATPLRFAPGQAELNVTGKVTGYQVLVYEFDASAGAEATVALTHRGPASLYHNVIAPSGNTVFNGSLEGSRFQANLGERGRYQIRVYLMRNDARRGKHVDFTLRIRQSGTQAQPPGSAAPGRPSFDCSKARGAVETSVCRNPALAELDARLAFVYRDALAGAPPRRADEIRRDQRQWLASRDACTREPALERCLSRRYLARIGQLEPKR